MASTRQVKNVRKCQLRHSNAADHRKFGMSKRDGTNGNKCEKAATDPNWMR
jgi:hypothetical protein